MDIEQFANALSASEPDWERERVRGWWDPGRKLLRSVRRYQSARGRRGPIWKLIRLYWVMNHRLWSILTQSEIDLSCEIAGGLVLPHPTGIIIHPGARIGPNCLIFHQVTLAGPVVIGGHVDIGAGARLLAPLTVGDHVQIGANAVVTRDLPSRCVAAGMPARVIAAAPQDADGLAAPSM